jgi:hypothetical protein
MSLPFDATLKAIVTAHPEDFVDLFGLPKDLSVTLINVDLATLSAATDVALAYGNPIQIIVDLNFQTGPGAHLPARLLLYNSALRVRHPGACIRTVVVLLRKKADGQQMTGRFTDTSDPRFGVEFWYHVVRVWEFPAERFLQSGLSLAVLGKLPEGQPEIESLRDLIRAIHARLDWNNNHAESERILKASSILMLLRKKKSEVMSIFQGAMIMNDEMTGYDELLAEGELRGEIKNSHRLLLSQGRRKFGIPDEETEVELKSIQDLDRLERMANELLVVDSWEELLATP